MTGQIQCTATAKRTRKRCTRKAIEGGTVCRFHGGAAPQVKAAAQRRVLENEVRDQLARQGVVVDPGRNPLDVLDETLGQLVSLRDRLGAIVARLEDEQLRYPDRAGEQARAELVVYRQVLTDTAQTAERIVKLGLAERRVRLQEATLVSLATAVRTTLRRLGINTADERLQPILVEELNKAGAEVTQPVRILATPEAEISQVNSPQPAAHTAAAQPS